MFQLYKTTDCQLILLNFAFSKICYGENHFKPSLPFPLLITRCLHSPSPFPSPHHSLSPLSLSPFPLLITRCLSSPSPFSPAPSVSTLRFSLACKYLLRQPAMLRETGFVKVGFDDVLAVFCLFLCFLLSFVVVAIVVVVVAVAV